MHCSEHKCLYDAKKVVTNLFLTEFFKVCATIVLLVVLLNSSSVNATSFIYGFLMAQSISWFVLKLILRLKA
jgi:F0F1-type ATP synthase assembly protein I